MGVLTVGAGSAGGFGVPAHAKRAAADRSHRIVLQILDRRASRTLSPSWSVGAMMGRRGPLNNLAGYGAPASDRGNVFAELMGMGTGHDDILPVSASRR